MKEAEGFIDHLSVDLQNSFEWMEYYLGELLYTYRNYSDNWESERPWDNNYSSGHEDMDEDEYYEGDYYDTI